MMAGIGTGFGAFADGLSSGYMMGSQFKKGMEENQSNGQDENVGTGGKDGKSAAPWAALTAIISNSKI